MFSFYSFVSRGCVFLRVMFSFVVTGFCKRSIFEKVTMSLFLGLYAVEVPSVGQLSFNASLFLSER